MSWVQIPLNVEQRIAVEERIRESKNQGRLEIKTAVVSECLSVSTETQETPPSIICTKDYFDHGEMILNTTGHVLSMRKGIIEYRSPQGERIAAPTSYFSVMISSDSENGAAEQLFHRTNQGPYTLIRSLEYAVHCDVRIGNFLPENPGDEIAILSENTLIALYTYSVP